MQMQVEQGKGTADHLMPLGDWFLIKLPLSFPFPFLASSFRYF